MDEQMKVDVSSVKFDELILEGENLDKALYDVMNTLWKSYRQSVSENSFKPYNESFGPLYSKYSDRGVVRFIEGFGMGLVNALNRRIKNDE